MADKKSSCGCGCIEKKPTTIKTKGIKKSVKKSKQGPPAPPSKGGAFLPEAVGLYSTYQFKISFRTLSPKTSLKFKGEAPNRPLMVTSQDLDTRRCQFIIKSNSRKAIHPMKPTDCISYKDFSITARPIRLSDSGRWKSQVNIRKKDSNGGKNFLGSSIFRTEQIAIIFSLEFGKAIIDRKIPGLSIEDI